MAADRITKVRIEGLRVFEKLDVDLSAGMTVLIGDNGSGKSTFLEAFELLRKAGSPGPYLTNVLHEEHGPFIDLLRRGSQRLRFGVTVEGGGPKIDYGFTIAYAGPTTEVFEEYLDVHQTPGQAPTRILDRDINDTRWFDSTKNALVKASNITSQGLSAPAAAQWFASQPEFTRLTRVLQNIECHAPFDVRPLWQQRELDVRRGPRWPSTVNRSERVKRYGHDLPAALLILRNDADAWDRFIGRARAALGSEFMDVLMEPAGAGQLEAMLSFRSPRPPLPLRCVSEGQLSYLIMLATIEMGRNRTLLVLDEPDIHYHPELVVNLVQILEDLSLDCPVIVATHSDKFLDALADPAKSVMLAELQLNGSAKLRRADAAELNSWLQRYRGLGAIRDEGYLDNVFESPTSSSEEPQP